MRRGNKRKFGRVRNQRKALYKALATALIEHGRIETTLAKAKSLSSYADKLVTQAKKADVSAKRMVLENLGIKATDKLFKEVGPKFADRNGGYTKILKIGRRKSDGAEMAFIEFVK